MVVICIVEYIDVGIDGGCFWGKIVNLCKGR